MTTVSDLNAKITVGDANLDRLDSAVNDAAGVWTTRENVTVDNLRKRLDSVGYYVPVAHVADLSVTNAKFTVINGGEVYAANPEEIPFTTTGTFDPSKWVVNPTLTEAQRLDVGQTFNVLWFVWQQPGGPDQVDLIKAGDHAAQNASVVTAGVHAAVAAAYDSGGSFCLDFGVGCVYRVNDGILNATVAGGKRLSKAIWDGDWTGHDNGLDRIFEVQSGMSTAIVVYESEFVDSAYTAGDFSFRALWNWSVGIGANRVPGSIVGRIPAAYSVKDGTHRSQTPAFFVTYRSNRMDLDFGQGSPRGESFEYGGTGVVIDSVNNSTIRTLRAKPGWTPTVFDTIDHTTDWFAFDPSGTPTITAPVAMFDSSIPVGTKLIVTGAAPSDTHIMEVTAVASSTVLEVDCGSVTPAAIAQCNVGFDLPTCSVPATGNTITSEQPDRTLFKDEMEGAFIFIMAKRDNLSELDTTPCIVSSVDEVAQTITVVGIDGTAVAFDAAATGVKWWVGGGMSFTKCYAASYEGQNDEVRIFNLTVEKAGGHQFFAQDVKDITILSGKFHGRAGTGAGDQDMDFTRCGACVVTDNVENLLLHSVQFDWPHFIDATSGRACFVKMYGGDNVLTINEPHWFGGCNLLDLVNADDVGNQSVVCLSGGVIRIDGWESSDTDHKVVSNIVGSSVNTAHNRVKVGLAMLVKNTGNADGAQDLYGVNDALDFFRGITPPEKATISGGILTVSGKRQIIVVDTEAGAATDDLTDIEGVPEWKSVTLRLTDSGRNVVVRNGAPIQTADATDVTLDEVRDSITLFRDGSNWREIARSV